MLQTWNIAEHLSPLKKKKKSVISSASLTASLPFSILQLGN